MGLQSIKSIVTLAISYIAVCFAGGAVMMYLESSGETAVSGTKANITKIKSYLEAKLNTTVNENDAKDIAAFTAEYYSSSTTKDTFSKGISIRNLLRWRYFCEITLSTIGYGDIVPITAYGKLFTILFAAVGIPIHLLLITSIGLAVCDLMQQLRYYFRRYCLRNDEPLHEDATSSVVMGLLLLLWLALGGGVFSKISDWSYMNGFYFAFITLSTIGFGDLLVDGESVSSLAELITVYTTVGLALAAGVTNSVVKALANKAFEKEAKDKRQQEETRCDPRYNPFAKNELNPVDAAVRNTDALNELPLDNPFSSGHLNSIL